MLNPMDNAPDMNDQLDTDALTTPPDQALDPMTPDGLRPDRDGHNAADGTMGTAQTGPGAGQHGDDVDPSGADTTGRRHDRRRRLEPRRGDRTRAVSARPPATSDALGASKTPKSL